MKSIKNYYSVGEKVVFKEIDISNNSFQTIPSLELSFEVNDTFEEKFQIYVKKDGHVKIIYGHPRAKKYALKTLRELIIKDELFYGIIEDYPGFKQRGIIEGFYGEPWTHADRLDCIKFLDEEDMNTYIYAPKDDLYHRDKWRESYPKDELQKLVELINESQKRDINFYFSISPGKDFNYTLDADFETLFKKIDRILEFGVNSVCLLLDDIDYKLSETDKKQFNTPGIAHSYICNKLNKHLQTKLEIFNYVMCPTEYWQNYDTPYRKDLKENLDPNITVFWTGYNTIAEYIPNHDGENALQYFGHELLLWDNYPVNDMNQDLLFMGPLKNRGNQLHQSHIGYVANPMIQWSLSKIPLLTMSEYMWSPETYNAEKSYQKAISKFTKTEKMANAIKNLLENFKYSLISYDTIPEIEQMIKQKNLLGIHLYYQSLLKDVEIIQEFNDQRFLAQFAPWIKRLLLDQKIVANIYNNNFEEAKALIEETHEMKHTVGTNFALKLAKEVGIYEGDIYRKYRANYWE